AINILTNDKVFKAGLRRKMRKAAMDRNYLASVLTGSAGHYCRINALPDT
ncbi:TPA: hypothetical protein ACWXS8_004865, partial [Escherichia coli]